MPANYVQVYTAYGNLDAETIRLFLLSCGIDAQSSGESVGTVYGLTVGPLGEVRILVPEEQAEEARRLLIDMEAGKFDTPQQPGDENKYLTDEDDIQDDLDQV